MMITVEDASIVALKLIKEHIEDGYEAEEITEDCLDWIYDCMERKAWLDMNDGGADEKLCRAIETIEPDTIAEAIKRDNLSAWCEMTRVALQLAIMAHEAAKDERK